MTTVKFALDEKDNITEFSAKGHSGYAEEGSDIVCAAVSACIQMLEKSIAQVIGEKKASFKVLDDAEIVFLLPENISGEERKSIEYMLKGFLGYMQEISKHYEDFLKVELEVKKC
ncbi:MAG: ribosomal-processing cysteine protease Prp [Monoglobales bacterium]